MSNPSRSLMVGLVPRKESCLLYINLNSGLMTEHTPDKVDGSPRLSLLPVKTCGPTSGDFVSTQGTTQSRRLRRQDDRPWSLSFSSSRLLMLP